MTTRDTGDFTTDTDAKRDGKEFANTLRTSIQGVWAVNGGALLNVTGTNILTADILVSEGFTAYTDGLRASFKPENTNTGAVEIDINGLGFKSIKRNDGSPLTAGDLVAGRHVQMEFHSDGDYWWINGSTGTTNVTITPGIQVQRSERSALASEQGPDTSETAILSKSFQCTYSTSRVVVEGCVSRITGIGATDTSGTVIKFYKDNVEIDQMTTGVAGEALLETPIYFSHLPEDTDAHTYEIRVSSTIEATYLVSSNWFVLFENTPN